MAQTEISPRTVRLVTVLLLVGTFAAGTLTGAALDRWVDRGPPHGGPPGPRGHKPFEELQLTAEQRTKVDAIFEAHRGELEAVLKETYPKVQAVNEQIDKEIRAVLTPEQQARFDEIRAHRPPPPPGPPGMGPGPGPGPGSGDAPWPPPPMPMPPPPPSE